MTTSPTLPPVRPRVWQALLGVAISFALLAWALHGVSFSEVVATIRSAHALPILVGVVIATATFPVRIPRWKLLLRREDGSPLKAAPLWHAVAMGFMANNILPFRAGELVRTYAVSRLGGTRLTAAFSSIAVERVFDGLTLVFLLTVALFLPGLPTGASVGGIPLATLAKRTGLVCLAALLGAAGVVAWPSAAERVIRRLVPFPLLAEKLVGLIEGVRQGLLVLTSPARLLGVVIWSLIQWLLNACSFYAFFLAFDIPVNFAGALLLQSVLAFGISVPSTPGYLGVFEFTVKAALALYSVDGDRAVSYALVYHFTTFLPIILLGLWSVARTNLGLRELRRPTL